MKKIFDKLYSSIETYFNNECCHDVGTESFFSAMKCYDNKEYEKALELYKVALKYEPNSDATYFNMGNVYFAQKEYDQALIYYKQASLLYEDSPNVNAQIAKVYLEQEKYQKALTYYLESEKKDEITDEHYIGLSCCYYGLKNYRESIRMCEKALGLNPNRHDLFLSIALNYRELKEFPKSIEFYKKSLAYFYDEYTLRDLAYVYYLNLQYDESKALCLSLLTVNQNDYYALEMMGINLNMEGKYKESLDYLLQLAEKNEVHSGIFSYILSNYFYLGEFEKSIEFGLKILEIGTDEAIHYCNIFEAQLLLNQPFTKSIEEQFIEKFKDEKESLMIYSHLKILENITLEKEVNLEQWKATYEGMSFIGWEFETLANWIENYENKEIKVKLLEALACFRNNNGSHS